MNKRLKKILIVILVLVLLLVGGFYGYVSVYYRADATTAQVLVNKETVQQKDNYILLTPDSPTDTTLIFYPGAKVEYLAYLPLLQQITKTSGINVILVKMPFNLAIFDAGAAEGIMKQYPNTRNWFIGGHSLGGAMASDYASKHPDQVKGLILLGAYPNGSYSLKNTLTVYGSLNTTVAEKVNYTENVVVIQGGNHAKFGNYGRQAGDPDAAITSLQQQTITAQAVQEFLADQGGVK